MEILLQKKVRLPDPVRVARHRRSPDLGPKLLFFSGGTALRDTSIELIQYTHNSIHIITPFDSGGSSARLRQTFNMMAIGDVRNRLLALADRSLYSHPAIYSLFSHRFTADADPASLETDLAEMIDGRHALVAAIPDPMCKIIRHHLERFAHYRPCGFDLRKASVGNLILTGGYLDNKRHINPVIFIFSKLAEVRGVVRPVVTRDLHLAATLENGRMVFGQHRLTGKEMAAPESTIEGLKLSAAADSYKPVKVAIGQKLKQLIAEADLICYPMGSFFTSLIANLLPQGIGSSLRKNHCPKVFIPNSAPDPETARIDLNRQVEILLRYLKKDAPETITTPEVLNFILLDSANGYYGGDLERDYWQSQGIGVIENPLISPHSTPLIDAKLLVPVLLSLA